MDGEGSVKIVLSAESEYASALKEMVGALKSAIPLIEKIQKTFDGIKRPVKTATKAIKEHTGALGKLGASIKRIAFYRAIRSAMKAITQSFREGVNNLVEYSKALGNIDSAHAVSTMNEFATTALYVKNSLGAMLMPVLQALLPLVNAIADAFVAAANAVNQLFHALKGEGTFTRAKKYATEYGDALGGAAGKAKEFKKQIFGFDELNIFNAPSAGGGGGGSGMDYSEMFEEATVDRWLKNLIDDGKWESIGSILAAKVNGIVDKFDAEKFGENLGNKLQAAIGFGYGFITGLEFDDAGEKLGEVLNGIVKKVNGKEIGAIVAGLITGAIDFGMGLVKKFNFAEATRKLSDVIIGFFDHLSKWLDRVDWVEFGATFYTKVKEAVTGIKFDEIANSFFGFLGDAIRSAWELATGFVSSLANDISTYFSGKAEECGGSTVLGFFKGIHDIFSGIVNWVYTNVFLPFWNALTGGEGFNIVNGESLALVSVGKGIVSGILNPIAAPFRSIVSWVAEHIVIPFVSAAEEKFDIVAGESTSLKIIGEAVIKGFFAGLKAAWTSVADWISTKVSAIKTTFRSIIDGIKNFKAESPRMLDVGVSAGLYAEGGQPQTGTLFWAGEAGAELIGQVGGKTTVTTHDQFSEGMSEIMDNTNTVIMQAAQGIVQAVLSKDMTVINNISDRAIVNAYDRGKRLGGTGLAVGSGIV